LKHDNFRLVDTLDEPATGESAGQTPGEAALKSRIDNLKAVALTMLQEVQALTQIRTTDVEEGVDFYEEVQRFEVQLIERALAQTNGHQGRAARLLNLKLTTLNSIIKRYNISPHDAARGIALPDLNE
jgi:transcriptional regulator with GAF, ATPase, and Fis domain